MVAEQTDPLSTKVLKIHAPNTMASKRMKQKQNDKESLANSQL